MNKDKLYSLLVDAIIRFDESQGILHTKDSLKILSTETAYGEIEAKESDAFLNARNALIESGKVLREERNKGLIEGLVFSGLGNMNPAVLVISVEKNTIYISAYAKEGLIKQHTAEKAIKRFQKAL